MDAGNDAINSCEISPDGSSYTTTVCSVMITILCQHSQIMEKFRLFAPGSDIPSVGLKKETIYELKSRTSMVSHILEKYKTRKPNQVYVEII